MWVFNYLTCLVHNHNFIDITWKDAPYQYCLHCGKVEAQEAVKEGILVEGERL